MAGPVTITLPVVLNGRALAQLRPTLRALARNPSCVLRLDGSAVADVSVRGLALLIDLRQLARGSGAQVLLLHPSPALSAAIRACGLQQRLALPDTSVEVA